MPCRRCGDRDPTHRAGRCQNVPASVHDWYEEDEPEAIRLDQTTPGPSVTLRARVVMKGGEPQAVIRLAPKWLLVIDPFPGAINPPFAATLLYSPRPSVRYALPVYLGPTAEPN